jgi:multimeric flavodoxin WrbA
VVDRKKKFGVSSDEGDGDGWPEIRRKLVAADILVLTTPIWMGQPASVAKMTLERLDAELPRPPQPTPTTSPARCADRPTRSAEKRDRPCARCAPFGHTEERNWSRRGRSYQPEASRSTRPTTTLRRPNT